MKKIIYFWLPPVLWMIFIFFLSSRQRIVVSEEQSINFLVFKTLHLIEYMTLFVLFFRAYYLQYKSKGFKNAVILATISTLLYAMSDELHQTFVPTRQGHLQDVFIDLIGITIGIMYTKISFPKLKRFL